MSSHAHHRGLLITQSERLGLSLVELVVAILLLTLLLGSIGLVGDTCERAFRRGAASSAVELRAASALAAVVRELETATRESVAPDPVPGLGVSELRYLQSLGFDGNDVLFGNGRILRLELEEGETDDGTDEDGDGLVDERRIVLVEDAGLATERSRVVAREVAELLEGEIANGIDDNRNGLVDERGFVIERRDGALDVQITFQRATSDGRESVTRTSRTSIMLRN